MPMVAPRLPLVLVHALLDDGPFAVAGHEEPVQVEIEAILDGGAVDLGHQAACAGQRVAVEADAISQSHEFVRRPSGMLASAAADVDPQFVAEGRQPALQGADDAGRDARGMPVHAHDGTERLEPERMRQPGQQFFAPVMVDDGLADHGAERRHAVGQPLRDAAAMQGKVRAAAAAGHLISVCREIILQPM
ncbi:MAG: hypothetical protein JWQ83_1777 [Lacunisphaera sp.]|nr:hypothetical protein [Lacunisphaera sp.]